MNISVLSAGLSIDYEWKPQVPSRGATLQNDCLHSFNEIVSLAAERMADDEDVFTLIISNIPVFGRDNHGRALYCTLCIEEIPEQLVHSVVRHYLLERNSFNEGIASCINSSSDDGAVDIERLTQYVKSLAESSFLPEKKLATGSYHARVQEDATWIEHLANLMQTHRFSPNAGVKMILSDIPGKHTNEADVLLTVDALPREPMPECASQAEPHRHDSVVGLCVLTAAAMTIVAAALFLFGRRR